MKKIQKVRGTEDLLPKDIDKWYYIEDTFKEICKNFGFSEIRTPMFELNELFKRGVGETTDIVQKEMFNLEQRKISEDKKDEYLTLKPEGTAPVVRSFIENSLYSGSQPTKLFYDTPCFRYEKPQKGRLRQFHQLGIEVLSSESAYTDAEVIGLGYSFFKKLGIDDKVQLKINSVGTIDSRKEYAIKLRDFYRPEFDKLCDNCKDRFDKNPMRILDCKERTCKDLSKNVPLITESLDQESQEHFENLQKYLNIMEIPYITDPFIVRGLDYYVKTAFEFVTDYIGSQSTVCGGGRYDGLVEQLGGPSTPGIGFALGKERLLLLMETVGATFPEPDTLDLYFLALGEAPKEIGAKIVKDLREEGFACEIDSLDRSMKAQLKFANKLGSKYVAILGENELENNTITLKNMSDSTQNTIGLDNFKSEFQTTIKR